MLVTDGGEMSFRRTDYGQVHFQPDKLQQMEAIQVRHVNVTENQVCGSVPPVSKSMGAKAPQLREARAMPTSLNRSSW